MKPAHHLHLTLPAAGWYHLQRDFTMDCGIIFAVFHMAILYNLMTADLLNEQGRRASDVRAGPRGQAERSRLRPAGRTEHLIKRVAAWNIENRLPVTGVFTKKENVSRGRRDLRVIDSQ